ncbi:MAG: alpha/beta hydrolase [Bacteroidota bacterium]
MGKTILFDNKKISISIEGEGPSVVLLHGYLESKEIWEETAQFLKKNFKVIAVDLPGHGETEVFSEVHTMELMADIVHYSLNIEGIHKFVLLGHSMGGYVSLAYAEKYPEKLLGLGLIHSSPYADTEEKKDNRIREIDLIKKGKKDMIFSLSIPNLYANDNHVSMKNRIDFSMKIAMQTSVEGICAALEGMKQRPERLNVIKNINKPVLMIIGEKDNLIPSGILIQLAEEHENIKEVVFLKSGHMSFFEEKQKFLFETEKFINFILSI